ncbi:MAG: hypothetical protein IT303_14670 [Dehalococcoidia bacterium]|nr:hypothetical protein [Dehalococcoidia bacterium]
MFPARSLAEDDTPAAQALLDRLRPCGYEPGMELAVLAQTGHRIIVALDGAQVAGLVRFREDEGIAWFDLLCGDVVGAGRELVRAVGRVAQDRGLRLSRANVPEDSRLPDYLGRLGYGPIGRVKGPGGAPWLTVERRLPLLPVREQRRSDAAAIGALTGEDPWVFEQGTRPGWFVLADGDLVAGVVAAKADRTGQAEARVPVTRPGYGGRGLEVWMLERAATWAETNGATSIRVPVAPVLEPLKRELEDRRWFREGDVFAKKLTGERVALEPVEWD